MPRTALLLPLLLLTAMTSTACRRSETPVPPAAEAQAPAAPKLDLHRDLASYANVEALRLSALKLDLAVDFEQRRLIGSAELKLQRLDAAAKELVLDTRALEIAEVQAAVGEGAWQATSYKLDAADPVLGSALRIALPAGADRVRIVYRTSPEASGLQWLAPVQTAGKKQPFLFSQSQTIHARSWVPLQDTPGVRFTYEARIRTPKNLLAVMGAENEPNAVLDGDYSFRMPQPIPSYLLALAVGELGFASTGPRSGIYAEPSMLEMAAREFSDTEKMIEVAEKLYGPYRWGRYDLLILPPSFPFGGMENPRLTFASPTVIVGDKSLVSLVAHELAHSWSGNLVTNASWRDFWLNEGFTSYVTNRLMEAVYGRERGDIERVLEAEELKRDLLEVPEAQRALAGPPQQGDPDNFAGVVAYNRGSLFLYNLELAFGRERFDAFLREWFDRNAFGSRITEDFLAFLDERLLKPHPELFAPELARDWIYQPALPATTQFPASDAFDKVAQARNDWLDGRIAARQLPMAGWSVLHWSYFLDGLPERVSSAQLAELDAAAHLTPSQNRFLLRSWLPLAINHGYGAADEAVRAHLLTVGRMYYINPVYRALLKTEAGRARAKAIYAEARPGYHPIAQASIDKLIAEADANADAEAKAATKP